MRGDGEKRDAESMLVAHPHKFWYAAQSVVCHKTVKPRLPADLLPEGSGAKSAVT